MKKITSIFLTVIATIAILWYLATSYGVTNTLWFLPLFAVFTAITTLALPWLCTRSYSFNAWISTGCAIMLLQTLEPLVKSINFEVILIIIFPIAFFTDLCVHGFKVFHFGELLFDLVISILCTFAVINLLAYPIAIVILLLIVYSIILIFDLNDPIITFKTNRIVQNDDEIIEE